MTNAKTWLMLGALLGFLAVLTGAFGSHGLRAFLEPLGAELAAKRLATWEISARYAAYHSLALLATGLLATQTSPSKSLALAGWGFSLGTGIFCGTLWLLVLTNTPILGAITPIGGVILLVAWIALALSARNVGEAAPAAAA